MQPKFNTGVVVITSGAEAAFKKTEQDPWNFIWRHVVGDWGDMPPDDKEDNDRNLKTKDSGFMSSYKLKDETRIWIITDAGREVTTILLPENY